MLHFIDLQAALNIRRLKKKNLVKMPFLSKIYVFNSQFSECGPKWHNKRQITMESCLYLLAFIISGSHSNKAITLSLWNNIH
jgi:hypothetical protein